MKLGPSRNDDGGGRPGHILARVRTSTAALIVAFIALFWVYQTVQPEPVGSDEPTQVVPPGFVPDPNYTWVPRTNVRRPKEPVVTTTTPTTTTPTETTTPSPTETTSPTSPTETTPAPFAPPETVPAPTTPATTTPADGPGAAPTTTAPPR